MARIRSIAALFMLAACAHAQPAHASGDMHADIAPVPAASGASPPDDTGVASDGLQVDPPHAVIADHADAEVICPGENVLASFAGPPPGCLGSAADDLRVDVPPEVIDDRREAEFIGRGEIQYRFLLRDPQTGLPAAHRPFALSNAVWLLPFANDGEAQVYQGMTDAQGRTPVFRMEGPVDPATWQLRERFGTGGPYSTQLRVTAADSGAPIAGFGYVLAACDTPATAHAGVTDANGYLAYAAFMRPIRTVAAATAPPDTTGPLPQNEAAALVDLLCYGHPTAAGDTPSDAVDAGSTHR